MTDQETLYVITRSTYIGTDILPNSIPAEHNFCIQQQKLDVSNLRRQQRSQYESHIQNNLPFDLHDTSLLKDGSRQRNRTGSRL